MEEGDDLSLLDFKAVRYRRKEMPPLTTISSPRLGRLQGLRRGVSQHTLEKICDRKPVRIVKLAACLKVVEELKKGAA